MFFVGGTFAVLMRLHLIEPQGALVQPETYNKLFTMHGVIMVFFFLVPSIPATLGEFPCAHDDRRAGPGFSSAQSSQLVHLHHRRHLHALRRDFRRSRHRLDVLHAPIAAAFPTLQ